MSKTPLPFDKFCVVWSRQFGDKFSPANSPTDIPQSPFMIDGAFSEVKFSGKPTFKWKLICMTMCTAVLRHCLFCHFLKFSHISTPLPTSKSQSSARSRNERKGFVFLVYCNYSTYNNQLCTGCGTDSRTWKHPIKDWALCQCLVSAAEFL